RATFAISSRIAKIPLELTPRAFDLPSPPWSGVEPSESQRGPTPPIKADEQNRRQHGPHNLQSIVAVRVARFRRGTLLAVFPYKKSQDQLRGHKHRSHQNKCQGEMMVDSRGCGGRAGRQPPIASCKEQERAGDCDQPDDDEKNEAHLPRPPRKTFLPHCAARTFPGEITMGPRTARVYHRFL